MSDVPQRRKLVVSFDDEPPLDHAWPAPAAVASALDWAAPPPPSLPRAHAVPAAAGDRALASWGRRAAAVLVDALIIWTLSFPVIAVCFLIAANSIGGLIATYLLWISLPSLAAMFYFPLMLARPGERNGQTLGKQALGVRVVSTAATGPDVRIGQALLREVVMRQLLFAGLGSLVLWIPLLLDVLWPLWHPERRALHDLAASTIVVRDDA